MKKKNTPWNKIYQDFKKSKEIDEIYFNSQDFPNFTLEIEFKLKSLRGILTVININ